MDNKIKTIITECDGVQNMTTTIPSFTSSASSSSSYHQQQPFDFIMEAALGVHNITNFKLLCLVCYVIEDYLFQFIHDIQLQVIPIHNNLETRDLLVGTPSVETVDVYLKDHLLGYLLEHFIRNQGEIVYSQFQKNEDNTSSGCCCVIQLAFSSGTTPSSALLLTNQYLIDAASEIIHEVQCMQNAFRVLVD